MQETASSPASTGIPVQLQQPIILNPGLSDSQKEAGRKSSRAALSTLGVLLAGWFFGNLILLALGSVGVAIAAGSTGLVRVPLVSERFFGKANSPTPSVDQLALENAQEKLNTIGNLDKGQTLKSVALDEEEINALLQQQVSQNQGFPILDPKIKLGDNEFVLSGRLEETNAPVEIIGRVSVSGLMANVEIASAKFGKINIPSFLASNLFEGYLSDIGLSLSGSQLPAKRIRIADGVVSLLEVSRASDD